MEGEQVAVLALTGRDVMDNCGTVLGTISARLRGGDSKKRELYSLRKLEVMSGKKKPHKTQILKILPQKVPCSYNELH